MAFIISPLTWPITFVVLHLRFFSACDLELSSIINSEVTTPNFYNLPVGTSFFDSRLVLTLKTPSKHSFHPSLTYPIMKPYTPTPSFLVGNSSITKLQLPIPATFLGAQRPTPFGMFWGEVTVTFYLLQGLTTLFHKQNRNSLFWLLPLAHEFHELIPCNFGSQPDCNSQPCDCHRRVIAFIK